MLQHLVDRLNSRNIILASGSPRRKELIHSLDLRFDVVLSRFDEKTLDKKTFASPALFVQACAVHKALEVSQRLMSQYAAGLRGAPDLVIGSDTIVCIDNMILEKPVDENDAFMGEVYVLDFFVFILHLNVSLLVKNPRDWRQYGRKDQWLLLFCYGVSRQCF